jgi:hypothetical protein
MDHIFMGQKKEWEWGMIIFDVKSNGLAMELLQSLICTVTIIEHKDILLGLVAIISSTKAKRKETGTHSRLKTDEKDPIIKCCMMVTAHYQPITGFMVWQLFGPCWDPSQSFEQPPLKEVEWSHM